jgi:flagella basal body P-ring formation protein FlgA
MISTVLKIALCAIYLSGCLTIAAQAAQPSSQRQNRIKDLIEKKVQSTVPGASHIAIGSTRAINSMPPCPQSPSVEFYGQGAYRDARVSCASEGWQLYIPIKIDKASNIVVAAKDLPAGKLLSAADLKLVPASQLSDISAADAHSLSAVTGQTLNAPVSSGTPIALSSLQSPLRVHAGETISVRVQSDAVRIRTTAVALQDGREGQSILVKNPSSGKRYRVEITATGAVLNLTW